MPIRSAQGAVADRCLIHRLDQPNDAMTAVVRLFGRSETFVW